MNFNKHLILIMAVLISLGLAQGAFADTSTAWNDATAGELSYSGRVGIGTTSPAQKLHVAGGSIRSDTAFIGTGAYGSAYAHFSHTSMTGIGQYALLQHSGGNTYLNAASGKNLHFRIDNSNKMILTSSGNVGIGTVSPQGYAKLEVNTTGNKSIYTMDSANGGLLIGYQGSTIQGRTTSHGNSDLILNKWGGNVGIGTTSPGAKLEVAFTSGISGLRVNDEVIFRPSNGTINSHKFTSQSSNGIYQIRDLSENVDVLLRANGDSYFNGGNVAIGTTDPGTARLKVDGNIVATATVTTGSSRTLKKDIESISRIDAAEALMALVPVKYRYKADDTELNIGFIAEDVPEMVATNDRKGLNSMDLVTLAITVIQEQQEMIENLQKENKEIKKTITNLSN